MMSESQFYNEIVKILRSFKIISHSGYAYRDKEYECIRESNLCASAQKHQILSHLQSTLYKDIHCRSPLFKRDRIMNYSVHTTKVRDFLISLSRNNSGQGTWQMGWRVKKIQWDGHLVVYKDSLMLRVQQNKFISETNKIKIGTVGSIKISKEFFNLSPGFYTAVGDEPLKRSKDSLTIRVYWNIMWRHAPNLMHMITEGLNKDRIPFTFKVLNSLENYPRSDAAVLYIQKEHFNITKKFLSGIYHALRTSLFPETSLFAKRIAKGLALAEDLGGNESFGQNRSRVLAEAMYSLNSETSIKSKLQDIKMHFQKFGFDLCSPYLNAGSVDDYDLEDDFRL